jgi:plastocyanin
MKTQSILALPMVMAAITLAAHAATPAAAGTDPTISINQFMFAPTAMTVVAGTTVHWKNMDPEPHTVRSVEDGFRSGALDQNDSFAFKFDKPGTYRYVCSIHPQMVGTVVVKAAN